MNEKKPKRESKELPVKDKCNSQIYISIKINIHRVVKNFNILEPYLIYICHISPKHQYSMWWGSKQRGFLFCELRVGICEWQCVSCELGSVSCELQCASCNVRVAMCELESASCELQCASYELQCASCNVRVASCNVRFASCNVRVASCNV